MRWAVQEKAREQAVAPPAEAAPAAPLTPPSPTGESAILDLEARRNAVEKETIERALAAAKGNKSLAARLLRISRNGLAARMRGLGIGG